MVKFNITQVNEVMWTYLADKATVHESLTEQKKTLTSSEQFSEILKPMSSWKVKWATTGGKAMDPNLCLDRRQSWFFFFSFAIFSSWNVFKNVFYRPLKQAWKTFTGWPHSSQNKIPCVFPEFSLCYINFPCVIFMLKLTITSMNKEHITTVLLHTEVYKLIFKVWIV